jgi:hypothetical protein
MTRDRAFLPILAVILMIRPLHAQRADAWVVINEPVEWSENRALSATAGTQIHVSGQAYHPRGIESVTVQGVIATIKPNPAGFVDFVAVLPVLAGTQEVAVVAKAKNGALVSKTLRMSVQVVQQAVVQRQWSPSSAAVRSIILPGMGQFYTKQKFLGGAFLLAAAGAAAAGVLVREDEVECAPVFQNYDPCPPGYEVRKYKTRPLLVPAAAGYVTLGIASALQARGVARRSSIRRGESDEVYRPQLGMFVNESSVGIGLSWKF